MREELVMELAEEQRREMFAALVVAQDKKMGVKESREAIAGQYGVDVKTVCKVEDEGVENNWPPFGKG
jgi:hypothetical protein